MAGSLIVKTETRGSDKVTTPEEIAKDPAAVACLNNDIHIPVRINAYPYVELPDQTYVTVAAFAFRGTTLLGIPTAVKFVIQQGEENGSGRARIYDVTNSKVIGEVTGITSQSIAIYTDSSLTDLPPGEAVFEMQIMDFNGKKTRIYEGVVVF